MRNSPKQTTETGDKDKKLLNVTFVCSLCPHCRPVQSSAVWYHGHTTTSYFTYSQEYTSSVKSYNFKNISFHMWKFLLLSRLKWWADFQMTNLFGYIQFIYATDSLIHWEFILHLISCITCLQTPSHGI